MIYAENILIFLSAPLIIGLFLLKGETRQFIGFFLGGLLVCLLSSYINSFIAAVSGITPKESIIKLTPISEEILKALPILFYFLVFNPEENNVFKASIALGIGFATFENCCYIIDNGASNFSFVIIRGFSAGIMHTICAASLGGALMLIHKRKHLGVLGIMTAICICATYHSIYNLLVSSHGVCRIIGYIIPIVTVIMIIIISNIVSTKNKGS